MRVNKFLLLGVFLLLVVPMASAVKPTQTNTGDIGIEIGFPTAEAVPINTAFDLHLHIFNKSDETPLGNGVTTCGVHIYDPLGQHILKNESIGYDGIEFELEVNDSIFTEAGTYGYIIYCNNSEIGGFARGSVEANINGAIVETADSIVYIGVLFFVFILSLVFMFGGAGLIRENDHIKWGGILLVSLGAVLLYGATFMANNYIIMMAGTMGGESLMSGFFLFFARMLKYSPYLVLAMVIYFVLKWRKSISDAAPDGWDNNLYS